MINPSYTHTPRFSHIPKVTHTTQGSQNTPLLRKFLHNFMRCGTIGWCMEICFTALHSLRCRDMRLTGRTSLWMFPIYGCAALISPLSRLLHNRPLWLRGITYMGMIFSVEYLSGSLLTRHKLCPWDYGHSHWNIRKVIRLDYAPFWFGAGLLFEHILDNSENTP